MSSAQMNVYEWFDEIDMAFHEISYELSQPLIREESVQRRKDLGVLVERGAKLQKEAPGMRAQIQRKLDNANTFIKALEEKGV
jgi:hypothetical protein